MNGYDGSDYGARTYFADRLGWGSVDPLAEKYYSISPYAYCLGNPINRIDPDGRWAPLVIFAGKALFGGGVDIIAQVSVNMSVGGQGIGDAIKNVDWTSVGSSAVIAGLTAPGMSTVAKAFTAGVALLDASTDISINNGIKSVATGDKSVVAATSDLVFSTLGSAASNKIVGSMKSAISSDLTSSAFKTLTTTEQSVLKQTSNIVNSSATQASVSAITNTITTATNEIVKSSSNSNTSTPTLTPIKPSKTKNPWILY